MGLVQVFSLQSRSLAKTLDVGGDPRDPWPSVSRAAWARSPTVQGTSPSCAENSGSRRSATAGGGTRRHEGYVPYGEVFLANAPAESRELIAESRCSHRFHPRHPGPRTTRPGVAPVCSPSRSTCVPFTNTCTTPVEYWCGLSNVAWSWTLAGSNTTTSA